MSKDFVLYMDTPMTPEHTLKLMFDGMGIKATIEPDIAVGGDPANIMYIGPDLPGIKVYGYKPMPSRSSYLKETLDIYPQIAIEFALLSMYDSLEEAPIVLTKALNRALNQIHGDAALIYNGFVAALLRKEENTIVDANSEVLWDADTLFWLGIPYELGSLSYYR